MTNEQLLTIIVSILLPLGGLILVQTRAMRRDMKQESVQLREDMKQMESRLDSRMDRMELQIGDLRQQVENQIGELRERMAHLEGLLEGLREAVTRRNVA